MTQLAMSFGCALFSEERRYRYRLCRHLRGSGARGCFIMLNPSTADEVADDPTVRRCIGFADDWGWRSLDVVNLFALRSTGPKALCRTRDPIGPENDHALREAAMNGDVVVAAWGVHGALRGRGQAVIGMLAELGIAVMCLGTTRDGHPRHPLYLPKTAALVPLASKGTLS